MKITSALLFTALAANTFSRIHGLTITQAGDGFTWTMSADVADVVTGTGNFPDIAIALTDTLTSAKFTGSIGGTHNFLIKDAAGENVAGAQTLGGAFDFDWTPSAAGVYTYYCAPHAGSMNGKITVTSETVTCDVKGMQCVPDIEQITMVDDGDENKPCIKCLFPDSGCGQVQIDCEAELAKEVGANAEWYEGGKKDCLKYVAPCCKVVDQEAGYEGKNPQKVTCQKPTDPPTPAPTPAPTSMCEGRSPDLTQFKGCNAQNDCIETACDCGDCTMDCPTCQQMIAGYTASPASVAEAAVSFFAVVLSVGVLF